MDGSQIGEAALGRPRELAGERATKITLPAPAKPLKPLAVAWSGVLGFIAGAVCWHFVGFWGFVKEAVFHARADGPSLTSTRTAGAPGKVQNRQPGSQVAMLSAGSNCTVAMLDRAGGEVQPHACETTAVKFHPSRNITRADRCDFGPTPVPTLISGQGVSGTAIGGWSARIETLSEPEVQPRIVE